MYVNSLVSLASVAVAIVALVRPWSIPKRHIRVRIEVGMNGAGPLRNAHGHVPQIIFKDTKNDQLAFYSSDQRETIAPGRAWTRDIRRTSGELKSLDLKMGYVEIYRVNNQPEPRMRPLQNEICVAYLGWSPDPRRYNGIARAGAITGDLWHFCGHGWHFSGKVIDGEQLRCGWMDGDNTNGVSVYRMKLYTNKLGKGYFKSYAKRHPNRSDICTSGVKFYPGLPPFENRKRSTQRDIYGNNAYVTAGAGAIELCDSSTSRGPSMLSLQEGIFCDMTTKTKVPICRDGLSESCMAYNYSRRKKRDVHGSHGTVTAVNVTQDALSHRSYNLEYLVLSDLNGTIIDDGSDS